MEGKKPYILLIDTLDKASYVTVMLASTEEVNEEGLTL